eukprot:9132060-Pyramimonas_sp.AAC.1
MHRRCGAIFRPHLLRPPSRRPRDLRPHVRQLQALSDGSPCPGLNPPSLPEIVSACNGLGFRHILRHAQHAEDL